MSPHRWIALLLPPLAGCSGAATGRPTSKLPLAQDRDISYDSLRRFELKRDEQGKLQLHEQREVAILHHSRRSTARTTRGVYSPYYAPVKELVARKNGEELPDEQMTVVSAQSDSFLNGNQVHRLKFKSLEPGDRISWSYHTRYRAPAWMPLIPVPNLDRVARFTVELRHPADVTVKLRTFCPRKCPRAETEQSPTLTRITFRDLPHQADLVAFPYDDVQAVVWLQMTHKGRALAPITPADLVRWYRSLFTKGKPLTEPQRQLVRQLVADADQERDKVKRIYDWVRKNIRYIADERGINGLVPRDPTQVMRQRYGDCKDMATLIVALCRQVGIAAQTVLVGTEPLGDFDGQVNSYLFNHAIAAHRDGDHRVFLDATCYPCAYGELPTGDVEALTLVLDQQQPELLRLPAPPSKVGLELTVQAKIDALKRAKAHIVLRGSYLRAAQEIRRRPSAHQETQLSRLVGRVLHRVLVQKFRVLQQSENEMTLEAVADLSKFLTHTGQRIYLPQAAFRTGTARLLKRRKDKWALVGRRRQLSMTLELEAPGFQLLDGATAALEAPEVATFRATLDGKQGRFSASYRLSQLRRRLQGKHRESFLDFHRRYLELRTRMFALGRSQP